MQFRVMKVLRDQPATSPLRMMLSDMALPAGDESDPIPFINPRLYPLINDLHVTREQKAKLLPAWEFYKVYRKRNVSSA
jgi:hypothetical protein